MIDSDNEVQEVSDGHHVLEHTWRLEYEMHRDSWKKKKVIPNDPSASSVHHNNNIISDGSHLRNALNTHESYLPIINQDIHLRSKSNQVDISDMIEKNTLNTEQARAFRLISEHSLDKHNEQLCMYLGGAGGTGKSRIINVLREFFVCQRQAQRFCIVSYTGVAAKIIDGMTIHSALRLNQRKKETALSKTNSDLWSMWEGVDYLFIDEISMIGCSLLYKISEALIEAKGNTSSFGGINVIFAGDFAQLPPVGDTHLSAKIDTSQTKSSSKHGQENALESYFGFQLTKW